MNWLGLILTIIICGLAVLLDDGKPIDPKQAPPPEKVHRLPMGCPGCD